MVQAKCKHLGKVTNLWAGNSQAGLKSGVPLKERARERLAQRELPSSKDFDEYLTIKIIGSQMSSSRGTQQSLLPRYL